jgi:hypothetical protein
MVVPPATSTDMMTIAPLLELADYQQRLLEHHLDQRFASLFDSHSGTFPIGMSVDDLISLLKQAAEFERTYGALYKKIAPNSPSLRTLEQCLKWADFLYPDRAQLMQGARPGPIEVRLAVVQPDVKAGFQNAGSVYTKFTIKLPLLNEWDQPAGPIEFETRTTHGTDEFDKSVEEALRNQTRRYRWQLGSGPFDETTAFVSDLHQDADKNQYQPTASDWRMSGDPWSLLTLVGGDADNSPGSAVWKIPVRIDTKSGPIGFYIGVQIGSAERTFPGTIAPPGGAGERPRMTAAQKYLTSP